MSVYLMDAESFMDHAQRGRERHMSEKITINQITVSSLSLPEAAAAISSAGFRGITVWRDKVEATGIKTSKNIISDHGLEVTGFCLAGLFTQKGRDAVRGQTDDARRSIDIAAELGAKSIVTVVGGLLPESKSIDEARSVAFDALAETLEHAREARVVLALEALHPMYVPDWSVVNSLKEANDWCDRLGPGMGMVVDTYHVWWDSTAPAEIARAGKAGRLTDFHVADWLFQTSSLLLDRGIPGEGVIDLRMWQRLMKDAGFDGWTEVELFSERVWAMPAAEALAAISAGCTESLGKAGTGR